MRLGLSKPLLAVLLATGVTSIVLALTPEDPGADADLLAERPARQPAGDAAAPASHWARASHALPAAVLAGAGWSPAPPPPPPLPLPAPAPVLPTVPDPGYRYLGRMVEDGQVRVFLSKGEDVEVVAVGSNADPQWRVEQVSAATVVLRYLPLNEVRHLAVVTN